MNRSLAFLAIAALGNVTYHPGQKTISPNANPMILLMGWRCSLATCVPG